jgi:hypothetical protein
MRKLLIGLGCCGLIFLAGWAFGQMTLDASEWNQLGKLDSLAQTAYVRGYTQGYGDGESAMEQITAGIFKGKVDDSVMKNTTRTPQMNHTFQMIGLGSNREITVTKIVDAMNLFYGDYRNAPICWRNALQFSVWSLNGDAPTDQDLDAARTRGANGGCK